MAYERQRNIEFVINHHNRLIVQFEPHKLAHLAVNFALNVMNIWIVKILL